MGSAQLHVYLVDRLLNPISEELAKQQTQWFIGKLHTPGMGGKHGEVKLESFSGSHLFGNFARYMSRHCLPLREEDGTMELHIGGLLRKTGSVCPAITTTPGASSFPGETSSIQTVGFPTHTVLSTHSMVSIQRPPSDLDQGTRDSILWWIIFCIKGI